MIKDKYNSECDGGQAVQGDAQAAAVLANGHPKAKVAPTAWGQKDRSAEGASKLK